MNKRLTLLKRLSENTYLRVCNVQPYKWNILYDIFTVNLEFYTGHRYEVRNHNISIFTSMLSLLWFLFNPRINLSPFTKDFRGEEHYNESID